MTKGRMEAFSDGVIAIVITIMVLELEAPQGSDWHALREVLPSLLTYVLSFVFVGIYWNNHHHMLHLADHINGRILWANLHLLFWLSVVPFVTGWLHTSDFASFPVAVYGGVLLLCGVAFVLLEREIILQQGPGSRLQAAVGKDVKGKVSAVLYTASIPLAFVHPMISGGIFVLVALMWLAPDPRIEAHLRQKTAETG